MKEFKNPNLKAIKKVYEDKLLEFILRNKEEILYQLDTDEEYQKGNEEVPTIHLFKNYLSELESEIKKDVCEAGYFNGSVTRLVNYFHNVFYQSSLPNLTYNRQIEKLTKRCNKC